MDHPRDLKGYGSRPPHPQWPGAARVAVQIVMNYEEGSEYSFADGDGFSENQLTETVSPVPHGTRDLSAESAYEFGSRVGFWRLMRIFAERRLNVTVFGSALALERNPDAAAAIVDAGHDVCCHGWRWIKQWLLTEDVERQHIRRAVEVLTKVTGNAPSGWYSRYGPSVNTRRLLVEHGGFLYDSDAYNDELPYWVNVGDRSHLVIPYTNDVNDTKFVNPAGFATGDDFLTYVRDSFDLLYAEGETTPRMMSIGLHMRLAGKPGRAGALARALDYIKGHDQVWICTRADIARHWMNVHPSTAPSAGSAPIS
jgi:allantoinase